MLHPAAMIDSSIIQALLLPFDKGELAIPERAFLLRAEPAEPLATDWRPRLVCEQSFKPLHDRLVAQGYQAMSRLEGRFPAGLCLLTKHKVENRANIARAWMLLEPGGVLVCCGANAIGAASMEREVDRTLGLEGHLSKHQARTFWLRRPVDATVPPPILDEWLLAGNPQAVADSGFVARAGCFSIDHVDTGSRLLADCFPAAMAGRIADLGAGWGYLSARALRDFPAVTHVDLYEAEALALEDARVNLAGLGSVSAGRASFHWLDVAAGLPEVAPYDWVISNPPFHEGRKADPALGRAFITSAWQRIRRRGKFLLVANRHLPYEAELRRRFREVDLVTEAEGFKVYLSSNRHDR